MCLPRHIVAIYNSPSSSLLGQSRLSLLTDDQSKNNAASSSNLSGEMFGRSLFRAAEQVRSARNFRTDGALRYGKEVSTPKDVSPQNPKSPDVETVLGPRMHRCTDFDRWMLVWVKRFPSKDQVPEKVGADLLQKAQSQARIKTANLMIVFTLIGCIGAVILGKRDAKAGKTVHQRGVDWHKKIEEEYKAEQAAAAAAASVKTA